MVECSGILFRFSHQWTTVLTWSPYLCSSIMWEVSFQTLCFPGFLQWNELLFKILEAVNMLCKWRCQAPLSTATLPASEQSTGWSMALSLWLFPGSCFVETARWRPWGRRVESGRPGPDGDAASLPSRVWVPPPWTPSSVRRESPFAWSKLGFLFLAAKSIVIGRVSITGIRQNRGNEQ